jgi:RNA polymerase sigma factor (sigma-70 family)
MPKPMRRKVSVATCAAALAATVGLAGSPCSGETRAIEQVERYCATSWRNAGIPQQEWGDCTQDTLAGLLERVPEQQLDAAFADARSRERRELKRAVWRTIQRWRRAPRFQGVRESLVSSAPAGIQAVDAADSIETALGVTTERQRRILRLWSEGWSIDEIADELGMPAPRASDEKYKALRKLQRALAESEYTS